MNTLQKVEAKLEEAQDLDDSELHLIPFVPAALIRAALRFVTNRLPEDPAEMEEHVHRALEFLEGLLPDPEPPRLLLAGSVEPPEPDPRAIPEHSVEPPEYEPGAIPERSVEPPESDPGAIPERSVEPPEPDPEHTPERSVEQDPE